MPNTPHDLVFWILSGMVAITIMIIGWMIRVSVASAGKKLDTVVTELKSLSQITAVHQEQIKYLRELESNTTNRLNDHAERIRSLELSNKN